MKEGAAYVFLREALTAAFGKLAKPVALGGVFVLTDSNARFHVLVSLQLFIIALPTVYNLISLGNLTFVEVDWPFRLIENEQI
ncbi:unnamed protein product [Hymenolepis diminuta]|uniref:Uncharacterized protein n=1 Tax=Hymenolepis diminuta TaxID=6216 RepID=A0A3P6ZUZ9_HYMDI|nr:unnamed protein product [Hymenolepis diminuta]